ncbi:MAG: nitrate ABC transporter permease, partial [Acutalibacteraceae bacterium]
MAFWLFVWHAASAAVGSEIILVSPLGVLRTLVSVVFDPGFLPTVGYSAVRIIGGFFIAMALGVVLGWVSSRGWVVETLLRPVTAVIKATP